MLKTKYSQQRSIKAVSDTVAYIRKHPEIKHTLSSCAKRVNLSEARFHKVFRHLFHSSLNDFIIRVKLEYAVSLMRIHTDKKLIDISYEAGFNDSTELSRSFKRKYGIAPSLWNRVAPLNMVKICQDQSPEDKVASHLFSEQPVANIDGIVIETIPAMRVATLFVDKPHINENLGTAFDIMECWLAVNGQLRDDRYFMGMSHESPMDTAVEDWRFTLSYPVDSNTQADGLFGILELESCLVARKSCSGNVSCFIEAWDALCRRWLPESGYRASKHASIEKYYADPRPHHFAYWEMDCILPIEKVGE